MKKYFVFMLLGASLCGCYPDYDSIKETDNISVQRTNTDVSEDTSVTETDIPSISVHNEIKEKTSNEFSYSKDNKECVEVIYNQITERNYEKTSDINSVEKILDGLNVTYWKDGNYNSIEEISIVEDLVENYNCSEKEVLQLFDDVYNQYPELTEKQLREIVNVIDDYKLNDDSGRHFPCGYLVALYYKELIGDKSFEVIIPYDVDTAKDLYGGEWYKIELIQKIVGHENDSWSRGELSVDDIVSEFSNGDSNRVFLVRNKLNNYHNEGLKIGFDELSKMRIVNGSIGGIIMKLERTHAVVLMYDDGTHAQLGFSNAG